MLRKGFPRIKNWDMKNGQVKYRKMAQDVRVPKEFGDADTIQSLILNMVNFAQITHTPSDPEALTEMADRFGMEIPADVPTEALAEIVSHLIDEGAAQCRDHGLISFSDMIHMPWYFGLEGKKYDLVAVDECQDLSRAQHWLVRSSLADRGATIVAVGDPRQAIYGFAGAESDSFDQMQNYFDATRMPLNYCYRCPAAVIQEAQKIVPHIQAPEGTREGIVKNIQDEEFQQMLKPGDMVLCRLTAPLVKLCFELIKRRIPARVKGRDIGAQIGNAVKQIMKRENDMGQFPALLHQWEERQVSVLRSKLGTEDMIQNVYDKVEVLEICYAMFAPHSVGGFIYDIQNLFSDDQSPITLCTIHRAKGLENPRVFIIRPDKLPLSYKNQTPMQAGQEMNLKYVAITRAKEELYFVAHDPSKQAGEVGLNPGLSLAR